MHTLAMFIEPGVEAGGWGGEGVLVGRRVANEAFLRALVRYGDVARYLFFIGEQSQVPAVQTFVNSLAHIDPQRISIAHRLDLPDLLSAGHISVIHHESHWGWFFDLVALRDRFSSTHVPVTGQIHSLSYPRMLESYLRGYLNAPSQGDAVFCSSESGRLALDETLESVRLLGKARGWLLEPMEFERALIPLGIDVEALEASAARFTRSQMRARLSISDNALVLLCLGRFSEYDKMDLFPLLRVFARLLAQTNGREIHLILAGARQGTGTPEMLKLWAQAMGVAGRVHLVVDFPVEEKGGWIGAADVFLSPSDNVQETFGLSVIEAMALGIPVVASDFDGYRDTIPESVGWRVTTLAEADLSSLSEWGMSLYERPLHFMLGQGTSVDPSALLRTLTYVCLDDQSRLSKGEAAKLWAREKYSWENIIPQYERVWNNLRFKNKRSTNAHVMGMNYQHVFRGHFEATANGDVPLKVSTFADAIKMHVHPELKILFDEGDVNLALAAVKAAPLSTTQLCQYLQTQRFADGLKGRLAAQLLTAWLLKHGLIERG
jgi:glycosyltransferase involved in cell wall biosynthesis